MRLFALGSFLPLIAAFKLPSAQEALLAADSLLNHASPSHTLTPASDLSLASITDEHTLITHPMFPSHSMRLKSTTGWCDPDVRSFSGYLDVGDGKDLFFYFFESRGNPKEDPVMMWINGGPGCSSALGLFMELGASLFTADVLLLRTRTLLGQGEPQERE